MLKGVTKLRIFVASPGDVTDERERLRLVVDELNRTPADSLGLSLELLAWSDVVHSMGRPEQATLDQLKLNARDIFVGILWTRFDTPPRTTHLEAGELCLSGTEEEFTLAYYSWQSTGRPRILFYRCMRLPQLDKLDVSQFQLVQQFFARFEAGGEHTGLYQSYSTPEEFERRVRSDLRQLILSYDEQLPNERQTVLKDKISELERREPLSVPFADREDEINLILSSLAPAYYLLDAPAGYGKTELLKELKRRLQEQGWVCAYGCAEEYSSLPTLASALAQELGISLTIDSNARRLGANLASALKWQKEDVISKEGLVLLIDLGKRPSLALKDLLEEFIPGVQDNLLNLEFFAAKHNRFRVIIAGRSLAGRKEIISTPLPIKVLKLTPFDYKVIRDTAREDYLPHHSEDSIMQISAHVMYLTGGHPGCVAHVLEMYKKTGYSPDDFLTFCAEDAQNAVWQEVDNVRNDIRPELRRAFDKLSIFRYLDYGILQRLIGSDAPVLQGYDSEYNLADELTGTYLFYWENRLLRGDITRRLLAIRLRRELGAEGFSLCCRKAQTICADYLRESTTQRPEIWAIEYTFHFLQQHADIIQDSAERSRIRQVFFDDEVPKALKLLTDRRNAREECSALKQVLDKDWEFRFTVNYYLREDRYSDEPFEKLQREIDNFSSTA